MSAPSAGPALVFTTVPFLRRFRAILAIFGLSSRAAVKGTFFYNLGALAFLFGGAVACAGAKDSRAEVPEEATPRGEEGQSPKPMPPLGRSVARPDPSDWSLGTHRTVALVSQNLVFSVPQGHVWESLKRRGTWSGLGHEATGSELWVRHVPARRTVSLDECEREARLSWPLLRAAGDGAADERALEESVSESEESNERVLRAPKGYGGKLSVLLFPDGGGRVEAFSVGVSRCLAVVFMTGGGPGFPERLRVIANEVIETMRVPNIGERSRPVRSAPY